MTFPQMLLLFLAAMLGGALNSVAGGGSFFTFPALVFTGVPLIQSNATSTVALWPASIASIGAYWRELVKQQWGFLSLLIGTSLIGGILGAWLLLGTSQSTFVHLLPYLLLLATLLFTFSGPITRRLRQNRLEKRRQAEEAGQVALTDEKPYFSWQKLVGLAVVQFIIAIYGGYFGGGIGILMLASLALMGMENIHEMNSAKTVLQACINASALVTFILRGAVFWPQAIIMIVGAILGGFGGAYYAQKVKQQWVRAFVMVVGFALTIFFFVQQL